MDTTNDGDVSCTETGPTHWKCPRCTFIVPVKFMRCTMCLEKQPRKKTFTPPLQQKEKGDTPPKTRKKRGNKTRREKRLREFNVQTEKEGVDCKRSKCYQHGRDRKMVDEHLNHLKKYLKPTKKRGDYTVHDVRRGLLMMVKGLGVREVEAETGVPDTSLRRNFCKCLGFHHRKGIKVSRSRWVNIEKKIANFELTKWGGSCRALLPDEEELIVCACEFAAKMCFPWSPLEVIRLAWNMMLKIKPGCPCPSRGWLRGFEKRWKDRLQKCKTSSIDPARAKQAREVVRDKVYENFIGN